MSAVVREWALNGAGVFCHADDSQPFVGAVEEHNQLVAHCREQEAEIGHLQHDIAQALSAASEAATAQAAAEAHCRELRAALEVSIAHLNNAKIDIETGAPKKTAIQTIEGGIRQARAALKGPAA